MIKYLGSKRTLLPAILGIADRIEHAAAGTLRTACDPFSGAARVGHALKRRGLAVRASDCNAYAATLARCYVQADRDRIERDAERLIAECNALSGEAGFITATYCEAARFFTPENGARIDAIRARIGALDLEPDLEAVLLTALLEAADRVDSTTGVQMAYLKQWAPRALRPLALRMPDVLPRAAAGPGIARQADALDAVRAAPVDLLYLDPPYNQHSYLGNYHIWETLTLGDRPETYGVAQKRTDCRERKSDFNSRPKIAGAMRRLLEAAQARIVIVSISDEGYLAREDLEAMLAERWCFGALAFDYKRYVGAQIGVHNPKGERVGAPGRLRNTEFLYVASADETLVEAALAQAPQRVAASA
jgi:adenine-specific DNA-methyltransferase